MQSSELDLAELHVRLPGRAGCMRISNPLAVKSNVSLSVSWISLVYSKCRFAWQPVIWLVIPKSPLHRDG